MYGYLKRTLCPPLPPVLTRKMDRGSNAEDGEDEELEAIVGFHFPATFHHVHVRDLVRITFPTNNRVNGKKKDQSVSQLMNNQFNH